MSKMIIKTVDTAVLREHFADYISASVSRALAETEKGGKCFIAYLDEAPAGYLVTAYQYEREYISQLFVLPGLRGRGVAQALIKEIVRGGAIEIMASVSDAHEHAPELMHIFEKLGFKKSKGKNMFRCYGDDLWDRWDAFMKKKGSRMCDTLRRQGYSTVTLAEASEELLEQYRHTSETEYHNILNHQHLIMPGAEVTRDVSVLCVREGRLSAYVFAYMPDKYSAIFKTLSSSEVLRGSGVVLLPLAEAFARVREKGCEQFLFSMDEVDARANAFRNKVLGNVITKKTQRFTYSYYTGN